MLIVSQNMTNYDVQLPKDTILRINLAWINDLETLKNILEAKSEIVYLLTCQKIEQNHQTTDILWMK